MDDIYMNNTTVHTIPGKNICDTSDGVRSSKSNAITVNVNVHNNYQFEKPCEQNNMDVDIEDTNDTYEDNCKIPYCPRCGVRSRSSSISSEKSVGSIANENDHKATQDATGDTHRTYEDLSDSFPVMSKSRSCPGTKTNYLARAESLSVIPAIEDEIKIMQFRRSLKNVSNGCEPIPMRTSSRSASSIHENRKRPGSDDNLGYYEHVYGHNSVTRSRSNSMPASDINDLDGGICIKLSRSNKSISSDLGSNGMGSYLANLNESDKSITRSNVELPVCITELHRRRFNEMKQRGELEKSQPQSK